MKVNVLFVIPPALPLSELESSESYVAYIPTSIPMGVLSIASYAQKNCNVNIKILDLNIVLNEGKENNFIHILNSELVKIKTEFMPDVFAISALFNSNFSYLNIISSTAKDYFPESVVVVGGGLPTNLYQEVLVNSTEIDAVCFAEGEIPFVELLRNKNRYEYFEKSSHWITRKKINTDFKPEAIFIYDLDEIPPLDYELINFKDYQKNNRNHGSSNLNAMSIMTSRGCPFKCCFCASHTVHGKKIRLVSSKRIISDIDFLIDRYNIRTFLIEDDHFLIDQKRAISILEALSSKNIEIEFPNGLAVYSITEEIVNALKKAGVKMATLAIESGSENVLKNIIHKPLKLSMVYRAVELLRSANIYIRAFFIIGFPGETLQDRKMTVDLIKTAGFNWVAIMIATPIAGSELYKICIDNGYLKSTNIEDFHYGKANITTVDIVPENIELERYKMNLELNFINNYDLNNGNYSIALIGFTDVIKRVPDHAFAFYFAAICYEKLNELTKSKNCKEKFNKIIEEDYKWSEYAKEFKLGKFDL